MTLEDVQYQLLMATARSLGLRDTREVTSHALRRLRALVNGEEIVYAEHAVSTVDLAHRSGTIVVFTARRVILAELHESPVEPDSAGAPGTVQVRTWSRSTLVTLEVPDGPGNSDWAWSEEWNGLWPNQRTQVLLRYADGTVLNLPLIDDTRRNKVAPLVPSLLADLTHP